MRKLHTFESELYPMTLSLIDDAKLFHKAIGKAIATGPKIMRTFPPPGAALTIALSTIHYGLVVVVAIGDFSHYDLQRSINILVHEAVHVWQFTADHVRIKHPDNETEAYHVQCYAGYLVKEFLRRNYK